MRVIADANKCVASGQCVMLAPAVFDQDDEGNVVLLTDTRVRAEASPPEAQQITPLPLRPWRESCIRL